MNNRLANLPENQFLTRISNIARRLDELKQRQKTSGQSGVVSYLSKSSNTWDFQQTINSGSPSTGLGTTYTLTFTGDGTQPFPMANPFVDVFANSSSSGNRISSDQPRWTDGTNKVVLNTFLVLDTTLLTDQTRLRWTFDMVIFGSVTILMKGYANGTSAGTVAIVRTS